MDSASASGAGTKVQSTAHTAADCTIATRWPLPQRTRTSTETAPAGKFAGCWLDRRPESGELGPVMNGEQFVRGLADAVPEVFAGVDLAEEYDYAEYSAPDEDAWARTIALADVMRWLEDEALVVKRRKASTAIRRPDVLRRFFAYMEEVLADHAGDSGRGWIMVELFEGIPWVEDVIDFLGPQTVALLREAQDVLARYNGWIGRWSE